MATANTLLAVNHVTHRYDPKATRPVLSDVSLAIAEEDIVALVGESGCGKTTLGKMVAGLFNPSQGTIAFEGNDISGLRGRLRNRYRQSVQLVHQDPYASLNPALTLEETLTSGMRRHRLVASRREARERVRDLLHTVELPHDDEFLQRYPHQLSGGQRQRIGIARALALGPSLIVADEAVSMLDVSVRMAILNLLLDVKHTRRLSYLFITHDFGVVRHFAEGYRIGVLYYGKLVEWGPCPDIILRPLHPYTYALLSAVPVPDPEWNRRRPRVDLKAEDEVTVTGYGCPFFPRCPMATTRCSEEDPVLMPLGDQRATACFFPESVPTLHGGMS